MKIYWLNNKNIFVIIQVSNQIQNIKCDWHDRRDTYWDFSPSGQQ